MEECSVVRTKRATAGSKDEFINMLFSWSLEDIFNKDLYRNQLLKIPELFHSVDDYLSSYVFPLLEETRAELSSAIKSINAAPFAEVIYAKSCEKKPLVYDVKVDKWKNRLINFGSKPYKTLPGDVVLVSREKVESVRDLELIECEWTFAYVTNVDDNSCEYDANFRVKSAKPFKFEGRLYCDYVVFLTNVETSKRIWNALHMRKNLKIIERVLRVNNMAEDMCYHCSQSDTQLDVATEMTMMFKLNKSQNDAIMDAIRGVQCEHESSVKLIWGPPGTGKTRTLSTMLLSLLQMNVRTLICAPSNLAVVDLASRVLKLARDSSCSLGEILIFGNKDRMEVFTEIEEVSLDYRIDKLIECLSPATGWKHSLSSTISFLEDCLSQYDTYVENEFEDMKSKSLLEFARERFRHTALSVRQHMLTFVNHLRRNFVPKKDFQSIVELISLLDALEKLLCDDNLKHDELKHMFSHHGNIASSLRTKCLCVLRSLYCPLSKLDLPSLMSKPKMKEFCFQMATLIFCTASSSSKLHSVDMKPIKLLVIDEAAQLKECESIMPLQLPGLRHAILAGDECQLPATVISKLCEEAGFGRSLFGRLSALGHYKHMLSIQYRMHPLISCFPNQNFYLNKIVDATSVKVQSYGKSYLDGKIYGPYSFINVFGGKEEMDVFRNSHRNMVEVAVAVRIVDKLFKAWNGSKEKLSIGVISPYAAQVAAIQEKLRIQPNERFTVTVKSIDGFQGGEEDVVIISTVRSNNDGSIGFLSSPNRTNVALTRARRCLWILGNESTLTSRNSVWRSIIRDSKNRQCFFNADEDGDLIEAIINVKKDLDQLEDLLSGNSILFKNARWKVLFSDHFKNSFGKLISSNLKKSVISILLKVSLGWRPKRENVDLLCQNSSQIVKQFIVEGHSILCTIDIVKESQYEQVLKVWNVLSSQEITKFLTRLDSIFSLYTEDYINCCKEKCLEGNLQVPKTWPLSENIVQFKESNDAKVDDEDCGRHNEESEVNENLLWMKFYCLSADVTNHLLFDKEGRKMNLPFEVTDQEKEIILFPRSSFILGRSGTGKTTVLTLKLYRKIEQYRLALDGFNSGESGACFSNNSDESEYVAEFKGNTLRQLFVAVNPKLCFAVKQYMSQLERFVNGGQFEADDVMHDIDETAEFEDIPDSFVGIQPDMYPLVITFRKFLMMLDGSLGNSYFHRFPISRGKTSTSSVELKKFIRTNEVNYDRFCSLYWPHFDQNTKSLDPSFVFTEIMSHIKVGLNARISREDYVSLSERRASILNAQERDGIYYIFEAYEKMKTMRFEFDIMDFVKDLHLRLNNETLRGDKMDFVYVDEVQDLTMNQISLFRHICKNVDEGFVFSGDTAQTIARGVDFRFEDIRSLFYNDFLLQSRSCEFQKRRGKGLLSKIFNLTQNFRTHAGVLRLSQSVIDLLQHFFPQSFDSLPAETSFVHGEPPMVIEYDNRNYAIKTIFGGGSGSSDGKITCFGADQAILVRDNIVKKEISDSIGDKALILTIEECKGLEFHDVLLFNFFGSSPLKTQWRVVYEFLKEKNLLDSSSPSYYPSFSQLKHEALCSELKQLYVAITRTRQRLWIFENDHQSFEPIFDYWMKLKLIQVKTMDHSFAQDMPRESSTEEWKSTGIKLFWEKKYEMAIMCFERAGERTWESWAKASHLRLASDQISASNRKSARLMLKDAAEIFHSIGKVDSAAECYCELNEYEIAGEIYLEKGGESNVREAGECFTLAGRYMRAAEIYAQHNLFVECLTACHEGDCFNIGLRYIEHWKQQACDTDEMKYLDKIEQDFLENCAKYFHDRSDNFSMMKYVKSFQLMELKRNFLKSVDCLEELFFLEEELGNFSEAQGVARMIGDLRLEVNRLRRGKHFKDAALLILGYVLSCSLWGSGSDGWPLKLFPRRKNLINQAISIAKEDSLQFYDFVCKDAEILSNENSNISELRDFWASRRHKSLAGEFLSVRKLLDAHFQVHPARYDWPLDYENLSEDRISGNKVSVETLFYFWNIFKNQILDILDSLDCLGRDDFGERKRTVEFCLNYFGVRKMSNDRNVTYLLMHPDAKWVENVGQRSRPQNRNPVTIDDTCFVSAARDYWRQELVYVGVSVVQMLEELYNISTRKSLSRFGRSTCLSCIFDIAKVFVDNKNALDRTLRGVVELSFRYFDMVFLLDSQTALLENMINLRRTEIWKGHLEEVIFSIISTRNELNYRQIGRVMMIWLGSGMRKPELCKLIVQKFPKTSSWREFVEILGKIDKSDSSRLVYKFNDALQETYIADWSNMPPDCFFYLVERLIILASCYNGYFFTTKSACVEWLMYCENCGQSRGGLVTNEKQPFPENVFDFLVDVIRQLITESRDTEEWIRSCNINFEYYYPLLVLRLLVILCLLCLNSRIYSDVLFELLSSAQVGRLQLPREFLEALERGRSFIEGKLNENAVAEALKMTGDPMVIVNLGENDLQFVCPDAVFVNMRGENDIMGIFSRPRNSRPRRKNEEGAKRS